MIDVNSIVWSENCVDPGCRVFFVGDRIFRAYDESRIEETLDFLNSTCYAILKAEHKIVNTWIANDVHLDRYPLILEHERLCCMPEKWLCFEMLKDILAFHFELNEYCRQYGFCVRDIGYGNVTLNKGQLCFIDFGSFRKTSKNDSIVYAQYCLPLAYLPLSMYCSNDGNDFIADSMIGDYDRWVTAERKPYENTLFSDLLQRYLHPIVSYYRINVRSFFSCKVRSAFSIGVINNINGLVRAFLPPKYAYKKAIGVRPVYSEENAIRSVGRMEFPYVGKGYYPVETQPVLQVLPELVRNGVVNPDKRIVLWGNFRYDDVRSLRNSIDCELIVMSSDRIYTNYLYKQIRTNKDDMAVICCNAMRGKDFKVFGALKADILVLQDKVYEQVHNGTHSDWPEKASYFAEYIITSTLCEEEKRISHLQGFYGLVCEDVGTNYQLYKTNK